MSNANQWTTPSLSDIGGILKRKNPKIENTSNHQDLLIFGYAAKIFRDDIKAIYIDQGKHLLTWNGEKIDRYDVRATLSDLSQYEPPPGGYGNRLDYLPPAEQRAEQLAEEERYYALKHNEEEELMYQEEELKRINQEKSSSYGQVQFDYNIDSKKPITENDDDSKSEEPDKPYVPPRNFTIPFSVALPDTMKQHAIIEKTARFISTQGPQMEILIKAKQSNNPQFEFLNQNNRLNPYYKFMLNALKIGTYPDEETIDETSNDNFTQTSESLSNASKTNDSIPPKVTTIPSIQYKPSPNCAYTQLISKIKGVPLPVVTSSYTTNSSSIVSTYNPISENPNEPQIKSNTNEIANVSQTEVQVNKISSALMLAQAYASDTEEETDDNDSSPVVKPEPIINFPIPPESLQNIIDKTAAYVVKNGKQFEETLRMKGDERFTFLIYDNEYHPYYLYKVTGVVTPYPMIVKDKNDDKTKSIAPVSFSIKYKDDQSMPIKPALPQEGSDDESSENKVQNQDTNNTNNSNNIPVNNIAAMPEHVKRAIQLVENQLVARSAKANNIHALTSSALMAGGSRSRFDIGPTGNIINRVIVSQLTTPQSIIENQKELKRAEEKVKDKLAQIAREKLGLISKEKQLQLERKKKAMVFLNQIKGSPSNLASSKDDDNKDDESNKYDSDQESVHSIPISSYGGDDDKSEHGISTPPPPSIHVDITTPPYKNEIEETVSVNSSPEESRSRTKSRSRSYIEIKSKSRSPSHKRKKSKHHHHHHSKKKSKKKSKSSSRSRSYSVSPSREDRKRSKVSSSKKSKKRKREK